MPRKTPGRKGRRKYLKGILNEDVALGTLAGASLLAQISGDVVSESTWLSSVKATWSVSDLNRDAGDDPLLVGVAHSDYTAAEIEGFIENSGSWDEGALIEQEIAKRKIRIVGTLIGTGNVSLPIGDVLNDGKPIHTKCGWIMTTGNGVDIWVYNQGSGTLNTGAVVHVNGHVNLWPR